MFLSFTWTDVAIARTFFFDTTQGKWIGASDWWVNVFLHTGGRWAIRALVLTSICLWIASANETSLRNMRRPAAYFTVSVVLSVGIIGLLKMLTNVDCPWDLHLFGGKYPFVHLFADRPDSLRPGHCFPAAHASSGFALMALYFVFRERSSMLAKWGLLLGVAAGLVFGVAQQSRGAHFLSHDVWSAFITWLVALTTYTVGFKARLWNVSRSAAPSELKAIVSTTHSNVAR